MFAFIVYLFIHIYMAKHNISYLLAQTEIVHVVTT
jgi:hypothetical protein